jgi:hypothetical protein
LESSAKSNFTLFYQKIKFGRKIEMSFSVVIIYLEYSKLEVELMKKNDWNEMLWQVKIVEEFLNWAFKVINLMFNFLLKNLAI